jgi:hypothetical protein
MDNLPTEILHRIFIQLELKQRLVCTLVCRNWWQILDTYSLFCNVELKKGKEQFNRMINMFERSPERASQVEELHVVIKNDLDFNKRKLIHIFPNVRVMRVESDWTTASSNVSLFTTPIESRPLKSKVKFLSDFHHCELASQLLYSNLGGRLETLFLDFCQVPITRPVISQLKDLPVLKKLTLRSPKIRLVDLENIHKNIQSIHNLALDSVTITPDSMPSDIVPATSITRLKFYYGSQRNAETHAQLYQYITRKYTSAMAIEYEDRRLLNYDSDERKHVYKNGILDFLKLIGQSQNKLTLYGLPDAVDPFESLDAVGSHIKELFLNTCQSKSIFQHLSQSKQSSHVEKLDLVNTSIDSIHFIRNITTLTSLTINSTPPHSVPIHLFDCLAACPPLLKSLSIKCGSLLVKPFNTKLDSVQHLNIGFALLDNELGNIISNCFPNLVRLELTGEVKESATIMLHNSHFQQATFALSGATVGSLFQHGFSLKSPHQAKAQHYLCHKRRATLVQYNDIQDLPILSVVSLADAKLDSSHRIKVVSC